METCKVYSEVDKRGELEKQEGGFMVLHKSKKADDFDKLERAFRNNEKLPQSERDILLNKIQVFIECEMNLALMESQSKPDRKNYFNITTLINSAIQYGMDVTSWKEKIDALYPLSFLREQSLRYFQKSIDTMEEYLKNPTSVNHFFVAHEGYRPTKEYKVELQALGIPEEQLNKILNPVLERFVGVYLSDAMKIARLFLDGKSDLRLYPGNPVTSWKRDFKDIFRDINKGNSTEEYQTIARTYHAILPEMLKIEAEIDIAIAESHIQTPMPGVK